MSRKSGGEGDILGLELLEEPLRDSLFKRLLAAVQPASG